VRRSILTHPASATGQERRIGAVRNISALPPRADVGADIVEPPLSAMCGRLRVGKDFLHAASWSVQPCVRPVSAAHRAAGHNTLRGSGPGQKPAFDNALALMGCPDRRIDRLCITCSACSSSVEAVRAAWPTLVREASVELRALLLHRVLLVLVSGFPWHAILPV
jgi:hypothetical protein